MVISVTSRFSGKQKTTRKCPTINSRYDVKQVKSEMQALVHAGTCVLLQENCKNFSVLKELCEPWFWSRPSPFPLKGFCEMLLLANGARAGKLSPQWPPVLHVGEGCLKRLLCLKESIVLTRHFSREDTHMANKYRKRGSLVFSKCNMIPFYACRDG